MLNKRHKNLIRSSIDYLFNFSTDANILVNQWNLFKEALAKEVPENHEFYHLRKFLLDPQVSFSGLEKSNDSNSCAYVAEVQNEIIEIAFEELLAVLPNHEYVHQIKQEIYQLASTLIPEENYHKKFITIQNAAPTIAYWPWENLRVANGIFVANLMFSDNAFEVLLEVNVKTEQIDRQIKLAFPNPYPVYTDVVLKNFISSALAHATSFAARCVLNKLLDRHIITHLLFEISIIKKILYPLLANQYYVSALFAETISLSDLYNLNLNLDNIKIYINPTVIQLLQNKICQLTEISYLDENKVKLANAYYNELLTKKISFEQIISITDEQQYILILPVIHNIIKENVITFTQATKIPYAAKLILANALYSDYISKHTIDWNTFITLTPHQFAFLDHPKIARLIKNDIFSITDIKKFPLEFISTLMRKNINRLLYQHKLSINALENLTIKKISFLDANTFLVDEIIAGSISIDEINIDNIGKTFSNLFAKKILHVINQPDFADPGEYFYHLNQQIEKNLPTVGLTKLDFFNSINSLLIARLEKKIIANNPHHTDLDKKAFAELHMFMNEVLNKTQGLSLTDKLYHLVIFVTDKLNENNFHRKKYFTRSTTLNNTTSLFANIDSGNKSSGKAFYQGLRNLNQYTIYLPSTNPLSAKQQNKLQH